jgi:hemerythrin-like domain-containing protein
MMDATKVMAALNTIEQDHQLVLDRMQALKDTVSCLMYRKTEDVRQALLKLREINKYFSTEFTCHSEEEEETLFPLLEKDNPEGKGLVERLRWEHNKIHRQCEEFDNSLQFALDLEDGLNKTVLRDVFIYGWQLWESLDDHARVETQAIHQWFGSTFPKEPAESKNS